MLKDWLVEANSVLSAAVVVFAVLKPSDVSNDVTCVELREVLSVVTLVDGTELVVSANVVTSEVREAVLAT